MGDKSLTLSVMEETFVVCRLESEAAVPVRVLDLNWFSITRTRDELSIVAPEGALREEDLPEGARIEVDLACLKVEGPLDFSLLGVLAALSGTLSEAGISVFAISTYNTDYLLVKRRDLEAAARALSEAGHAVSR